MSETSSTPSTPTGKPPRGVSRRLLLAGAALGVALLAALAVNLGGPGVVLQNARATPMGAGGSVAITLDIESLGGVDRLLGANAPQGAARLTGLDGGDHVPIPAGGSISLAPDGAHVMVVGLDGALGAGRLVDVVLVFERAGELAVQALVASGGPMAHGAMFEPPAGEPQPAIAVDAIAHGGGGWTVLVETENFSFAPDSVDGPHVPGQGHAHLFVNGGKIGRLFGEQALIPTLPPGVHRIRATLNTNDHRAYAVEGAPVSAFRDVRQQ